MKRKERVISSGPRDRKKPYKSPRVITYGHVKDIVKGVLQVGNDGGVGHSKNCWIAESLYGVDSPRTLLVRGWLAEMAAATRRWQIFSATYTVIGRRVAGLIGRGWLPRTPFRRLFDALVARATDHSMCRVAARVTPR